MREEKLKRLFSYKVSANSIHYLEHRFLLEALQKAITSFAKGDLLDIGCGNKPYEELLRAKITKYIGCDVVQSSSLCVDVICEATSIPLSANSFDTIFSTQTIEHIGNFQEMLNESFRLCKPGGYFIVSGPMYWPLHEEPYDFFRFTKHGFHHSLTKAGFEVVEMNPNGGKWALMGQVIIQTLPTWLTFPKILKWLHNRFFIWLDKNWYDSVNTMNYVVVARKPL